MYWYMLMVLPLKLPCEPAIVFVKKGIFCTGYSAPESDEENEEEATKRVIQQVC